MRAVPLYDEKNTRVMLDENGISLWDPQGHVTASLRGGVLMLGREGESDLTVLIPGTLSVEDEEGFSAVLGKTTVVTPRTGEKHKTSAASLFLFDSRKNVIWKAP